MDVVVAATGEDEDNIVVANLAKFEYEVPRVVARVKNALNTWLYQPDIGVDLVVSAPHTIAQLIEEQVAIGDVGRLVGLAEGGAAIVETTVPADSPLAGRAIGDIEWPPDCVPIALLRASRILPASPGTTIEPTDALLFLTKSGQAEALHQLLVAGTASTADEP
jgi:trk system potassium uptake protein TrkA